MELNSKQYGGFKIIESTIIQIKKMFLLVIKKIEAFINKFIINPTKKGLESVLKNINKLLKKTFSKTSKHINKIDNKIQSGGGIFTFLKTEVSTAVVRLKSGFLSKIIFLNFSAFFVPPGSLVIKCLICLSLKNLVNNFI